MKCEIKKQEAVSLVSVAQKTIEAAAKLKHDERIIGLCATLDLIASEAQYHFSCYRNYTRAVVNASLIESDPPQSIIVESTSEEENIIHIWFEKIRQEFVSKKRVALVEDLLFMLEGLLEGHVTEGEFLRESFLKRVRRKLKSEFEGIAEIFLNQKGKLVFLPNTISKAKLAEDYLEVQKQLEKSLSESDKSVKLVKHAALVIRHEVSSSEYTLSWPPTIPELNPDIKLPNLLQVFLSQLLHGSSTVSLKTSSLGQDIMYNVHNGRLVTPKHLLIPFAIKAMTGNVELVKIINRLGHGVSGDKLSEVDTAYAIQKLTSSNELLPDGIELYHQASLVYDNIDRLEESLSGAGTTHRVNGIVVQKSFYGPRIPNETVAIPKTHRRSIHVDPLELPVYNVGTRPEPPTLGNTDISNIPDTHTIEGRKKDFIWVLCRNRTPGQLQEVSSWTGFNISTRMNDIVIKDTIGYLPTIDSPATAMNTVFEILSKAVQTKEKMKLKSIIVVFDQAIYAKAVEIIWKHQDLFSDVVPRLGAFHTICVLLSIIGKRFGPAGLRDVIIESGVIEEGSVEAVLNGKAYNRAVRFHKLMYEACMRLVWQSFVDWLKESNSDDVRNLDILQSKLQDLIDSELNPIVFRDVLNSEQNTVIFLKLQQYMNTLRNDNGTMSAFWMSYIDLACLLLDFLRASRERNWNLHLSSVKELIPWCFAYGNTNYARYLPWYLIQMINLKTTHPELHDYLMDGGFSTQIGGENPFGCIPMDQTIEETINKDTQTPGGTRGFSMNKGAVAKHYITADYRASCVRQLRDFVNSHRLGIRHPDLSRPRILKDEEDIQSLIDMLQNLWQNPFARDLSDLCNLSTGAIPEDGLTSDVLSARVKGEEACSHFISERLSSSRSAKFFDKLPRIKLKSFRNVNTKRVKASDKEVVLRADKNLFSMMTLISQNRELDMKEVLAHPLGPIPWSLACNDGTLRKTSKATLGKILESLVEPAEKEFRNSACVIDAMSIVQKTKGSHGTFKDVAESIFAKVLAEGRGFTRIDLVFDVYREISIKNAERQKRANDEAVQFNNILASHKIKQWYQFLQSSSNKSHLIKFLCHEWQSINFRSKLKDQNLYLGFDEECLLLTSEGVEVVEHLRCNHEEADTRILLHAKHAASSHESVVIVCEDTDVLVLAVSKALTIGTTIFQKRGSQSRTRFVNVSKISDYLGAKVSSCLPGLHAFTGCDSVSAFAGKGKAAALKLVQRQVAFQTTFNELGEQFEVRSFLFLLYFGLKIG